MTSIDELALEVARLQRQIEAMGHPQLGFSSFDVGAIQQYRPDDGTTLVQRIGTQFDGAQVAAAFNGPTPPTPTAPTLAGDFGGISVTWDGFFEPDQTVVAPTDFARVEVHLGDTVDFDATTAATLRTTFETPRGGTKFVAAAPGTRYVRLVARSLSGKASLVSASTSVVVEDPASLGGGNVVSYGETPPVADGSAEGDIYFHLTPGGNVVGQYLWDGANWVAQQLEDEVIAGIAVGKLIAGVLAADTAIIAGDPGGANVRMDGDLAEFAAYDSAGQKTVQVNGDDNVLVGELRTGFGGSRVEVKPDGDGHVVEFFGDAVTAGKRAFLRGVNQTIAGYGTIVSALLRSETDIGEYSELAANPAGVDLRVVGPGTSVPAGVALGRWWSVLRSRRTRLQAHVVDPTTGALDGSGTAQIELKGNADPAGGTPTSTDWGGRAPRIDLETLNQNTARRSRLTLDGEDGLVLSRYDGSGSLTDDTNLEPMFAVYRTNRGAKFYGPVDIQSVTSNALGWAATDSPSANTVLTNTAQAVTGLAVVLDVPSVEAKYLVSLSVDADIRNGTGALVVELVVDGVVHPSQLVLVGATNTRVPASKTWLVTGIDVGVGSVTAQARVVGTPGSPNAMTVYGAHTTMSVVRVG